MLPFVSSFTALLLNKFMHVDYMPNEKGSKGVAVFTAMPEMFFFGVGDYNKVKTTV